MNIPAWGHKGPGSSRAGGSLADPPISQMGKLRPEVGANCPGLGASLRRASPLLPGTARLCWNTLGSKGRVRREPRVPQTERSFRKFLGCEILGAGEAPDWPATLADSGPLRLSSLRCRRSQLVWKRAEAPCSASVRGLSGPGPIHTGAGAPLGGWLVCRSHLHSSWEGLSTWRPPLRQQGLFSDLFPAEDSVYQ